MARGRRAGLTGWLGGSLFIHVAALALLGALAGREVIVREEVLKVSLVTVAPERARTPPSPPPAPPVRDGRGERGREGAGRLGGGRRSFAAPAPRRENLRPPESAGLAGSPPTHGALPGPSGTPGAPDPVPLAPRPVMAEVTASGPAATAVDREGPSEPAAPQAEISGSDGRAAFGTWPSAGQGGGLGQGGGRSLAGGESPGGGLAGIGRGAGGGGTGPAVGGGRRPADIADLLGEIRRRIEAAKRYPETARREGIQGSVAVRFRVRADGQVEAAEVVRSSGYRVLDEESVETIRRAAPFPPLSGWVQVPIAYTLAGTEP